MTNLNTFARDISTREGLKKQVNIAQIKEVTRYVLLNLKGMSLDEIIELLKRIK